MRKLLGTIVVSASLALAVIGSAVGGSLARAETPEEMARDLVPAQKPLYEFGGLGPDAGVAVEAWVDRQERIYAVGHQLKVFVRPKQTSYITVLNVGTSGRVAVIFPNFHQRDMQVRAGQTVAIPADGASWKIDIVGPIEPPAVLHSSSRTPSWGLPRSPRSRWSRACASSQERCAKSCGRRRSRPGATTSAWSWGTTPPGSSPVPSTRGSGVTATRRRT